MEFSIDRTTKLSGQPRKEKGRFADFLRDEEGSFTLEATLWLPIFAIVLTLIMNISTLFFYESHILRVVQDGNRSFSLGRFENSTEVENYILDRLAFLDAEIDVATSVSSGVVLTSLNIPASDLMPMSLLDAAFESVNINVTGQHLIEY